MTEATLKKIIIVKTALLYKLLFRTVFRTICSKLKYRHYSTFFFHTWSTAKHALKNKHGLTLNKAAIKLNMRSMIKLNMQSKLYKYKYIDSQS